MRKVPGRKGVGRKALMHHGQRRNHALIPEVAVILADLVREQHALVDDGARRHRRHVELLAVPELERLDGVAGFLADDVELPLQRILVHVVGAAGDEDLPDHRLDLLGPFGQARVVGWHIAPAEQ